MFQIVIDYDTDAHTHRYGPPLSSLTYSERAWARSGPRMPEHGSPTKILIWLYKSIQLFQEISNIQWNE